MERRVVVTGMGSVSPFGLDVDTTWKKLLDGDSCISTVESVDLSDCSSKIGGEIKWVNKGGWFNAADFMPAKDTNRVGRFIPYGLASSVLAMSDAGLNVCTEEESSRFGVILGTGAGGMDTIESGVICVKEKGCPMLTPFFVPSLLCNLVCGHVSIKFNIKGPNFAVVSACASGNHAIGESYRMIKHGYADVVLGGGAESIFCRAGFAGFASMRALSTRNDDPAGASRPYDKARDGFVVSEGAAILVLEEYERAKKRGAKIYAEIKGYGLSGDAYHIAAPHPDGKGAISSMKIALDCANIGIDDISYINAHGTSTPAGDMAEIIALRAVFGDKLKEIPISSTKSSTGHMLGAAAALEAVFCIKALNEGVVPATINLHDIEDSCKDLNLVPNIPQNHNLRYVMSNAFGFGGCNATIVFGKP